LKYSLINFEKENYFSIIIIGSWIVKYNFDWIMQDDSIQKNTFSTLTSTKRATFSQFFDYNYFLFSIFSRTLSRLFLLFFAKIMNFKRANLRFDSDSIP
jgi:hypothetical protein